MQSSRAEPITGERRLEILARFEQNPEQAKLLAKESGISEITLHDWATTFKKTGGLGEAPTPQPTPPPKPGPSAGPSAGPSLKDLPKVDPTLPAGRGFLYPYAIRLAAAQALIQGLGTAEEIALHMGLAYAGSVQNWARALKTNELRPERPSAKTPTSTTPSPNDMRQRRLHPPEFRYNAAKAVIDGELRLADAARKFDVHPTSIQGWIKQIKDKKLKPPKQAPAEVVEEYRPPKQTALALPSRTELTRVTTVQEEIAKRDVEIARLRRLLQQTQAMLLDNGQ